MKNKLGAKNILFPMPTILVGANIGGKPNYITVAHCGIAAMIHITISLRKGRFTCKGIKEKGTFSVNIPSVEMVKETDYCGLVSGQNIDKSKLFQSFYGILGTAPMIQNCPINMECKLKQTLDFPNHEIFIGEVVESYCEEEYVKNGVIDMGQVQPILFGPGMYFKIGEPFAKTFSVGKGFLPGPD
jgi:flavin reductase (DIM6/NTAB) family NADH-FMN oxidoreductase RutF